MPWKETDVETLKTQFILLYLTRYYTITDLCESFGISRKTGHRLIKQYKEYGLSAIENKSSAPHAHPNATSPEIAELILRCKEKHPRMGPKKLKVILQKENSSIKCPAVSTIGEILKRNGLTTPRNRRGDNRIHQSANPIDDQKPNNTWCADYKGQFALGDNALCYPLTISDACSRMLINITAFGSINCNHTIEAFERAFKEYGMPLAMRTDNGPPFAGSGLGGLSTLSVWLTRLGIRLDRIDKGHPGQNGRHERMHRELKAYTASPPAYDMVSQQRSIDMFVSEYNNIRPHESLDMNTPASLYAASSRAYPDILPEIEYPDDTIVRRVRSNGCIKWKGAMVFISEPLYKEPVGLVQLNERFYAIYYSDIPLAILDDHTCKLLSKRRSSNLMNQFMEAGLWPSIS